MQSTAAVSAGSPQIAESVVDLVGNTPLLKLGRLNTTSARILLKMESENPLASVKDRLAAAIIRGAERDGKIKPGDTLIEATSGNTGVALAALGASLGYKVVICMPEQMSLERRALIRIFGARLVLTPARLGIPGSVAMAEKIARETPRSYLTSQFTTPYNAEVHRDTTGPEIWSQTGGKVDYCVAGAGTGGTVSGIGQFLKTQNPDVKMVAVEPTESPVLSGGKPGPHKIQGIGAGFVPVVYDKEVIDEVVPVSSDEAMTMARMVPTTEGLFVGVSSGAAIAAALTIARRPEAAGKTIVVLVPSFGERYLSTPLYSSVMDEVREHPVSDPRQ